MRNLFFILSLLILASLACNIGTAQAPASQPASTNTPRPTRPPVEATQPATQAPEPAVTLESTPAGEAIPPSIARQMDEIQTQVIDLRGLLSTGDLPRALLSPEQLRQRVTDDFLGDYTPEEASDDVLELAAWGLLEPGFDLRNFYIDLLSEQIAGFYDHEVGDMYVVQGAGFGGPERFTYSHEYTHALQDMNFDIENGLNYSDAACEVDTERCAGIQSLIEGDATLASLQWFTQYATPEDQQQLVDFYNNLSSPIFDTAPAFMQEDFVFPYNYGYIFVQALYDAGGWDAVDAAYANLPVSTEQILHPERYPDDRPVAVAVPDLLPVLGDGWREIETNVMGEWYTYLVLSQGVDPSARLDVEAGQAAAAGWGGDTYKFFANDASGSSALVLKSVWDTRSDEDEFIQAFEQYGNARFGVSAVEQDDVLTWSFSGGVSLFDHSGEATIWVLAPDAATAQALLQALQGS